QGEKDGPGEICLASIRSSPGEVSAFGLVSPRKELLPARRPEGGFAWNAVGFSPTSTTGPKAGHRGGTSPAGRGPRCRTTSGAAPACWPVECQSGCWNRRHSSGTRPVSRTRASPGGRGPVHVVQRVAPHQRMDTHPRPLPQNGPERLGRVGRPLLAAAGEPQIILLPSEIARAKLGVNDQAQGRRSAFLDLLALVDFLGRFGQDRQQVALASHPERMGNHVGQRGQETDVLGLPGGIIRDDKTGPPAGGGGANRGKPKALRRAGSGSATAFPCTP